MVLMKKRSVKCDQSLPVVASKFAVGLGLSSRCLCPVNVNTLGLYHCQASIDALHL
jgi:hypothetical protein